MPKNYYNPQDDVVQIKDGKRMPVQAYDLYQGLHAGPRQMSRFSTPETNDKNKAPDEGELSMKFDGRQLTLTHRHDQTITDYHFPAVSGKPLDGEKDTFDYSKERQYQKNEGPIPEGKHKVEVESANYWKDARLTQKIKSFLGGGEFPGGPSSWGEGHVDVTLAPDVAKATGRSGITIHGGSTPGSKGCIDLVNHDKDFFSKLEELKGKQTEIPLTVDYSNIPKKVHWDKNAKPTKEERKENN